MIGHYEGEKALYLADANDKDPSILLYGNCDSNTGRREFIKNIITSKDSSAVSHPYGLCTDDDGN